MMRWGDETMGSFKSHGFARPRSHGFALPLCFGALVILPFEIPRWLCWQAHHVLRGFGLR